MTLPATSLSRAEYEEAARNFRDNLPLEHFMEATTQSGQRAVTDASFALLAARGVPLGLVGELLVQYFYEGNLRQVVPDNMLVRGPLSGERRGSWDLEYEPQPILMTMEYVSPRRRRKDYVENLARYQDELEVPYYLLVEHERDELRLHRLDADTGVYQRVPANPDGRFPMPDLELEVGWLAGWARFWHRGVLVPIPAELNQTLDELREQLRRQAELLERQEVQLRQKDDALRQKDDALRQFADSLRPLVELRARASSRQDILDQLPTVADAAQLTRWLTELN